MAHRTGAELGTGPEQVPPETKLNITDPDSGPVNVQQGFSRAITRKRQQPVSRSSLRPRSLGTSCLLERGLSAGPSRGSR